MNQCDCKMQIAKCKLQIVESAARSLRPLVARRDQHRAFTLFELILALALSATLLALIGTAVNLYLVRMDFLS